MREAFEHIRADYPESEVVVVSNHIYDSYQCQYTLIRKGFCGVPGTPTYQADLVHQHVGGGGTWNGHYNTIAAWIAIQLAKSAPCTLDIVPTRYGDEITVSTTITLDANISGRHDFWVCVYQESVGSWDYMVRDGAYPTEIGISSSGESETIDWTFDIDGSWDENDLYVVAYLNEYSGNKEVVQSKMMYLDMGTINVEETTWGQIKANIE